MKLGTSPIILDKHFSTILKRLENISDPIFITGRAGTGKSTLLRMFQKTTKQRVVVVAPTGIAALNVRGQTIHSFFGFPPKLLHPDDISVRKNKYLYRRFDVLVIDEISMVRADMLDNIDQFLRLNRDNDEPFGGVKLIMIGDMFQLPPVVATEAEKKYISEHYRTPYFFSAHIFDEVNMEMFELTEVHRQTDRNFIRLLDNVRTQSMDFDDLEELNQRVIKEEIDDAFFITMCARNAQVNSINRAKLGKIDQPEYTYLASVQGQFSDRQFPTDLGLRLREGAQVMFIKNDTEKRYVNGTIGKIVRLDDNEIIVEVLDLNGTKSKITVEKFVWEIIKYRADKNNENLLKTEVVGSFTQYPLRLAWAITIHKSQGKTFDRAIIDLGTGAFESGQTYVALSRCRTMEGIFLKRPLTPKDIFVDSRVCEFFQYIRQKN